MGHAARDSAGDSGFDVGFDVAEGRQRLEQMRAHLRHLYVVRGEDGEEAASDLAARITGVEAAVAALDEVDLDAVPDGAVHDAVVALRRVSTRLEAASTGLVGRWDARGVWSRDGSRSPGARLSRVAHLSNRDAAAQVRRARRLADMELVAEAFAEGRISAAHVDRLAAVRQPRTEDAFGRDEAQLVGFAQRLRWRDFERALAYWRMHADPDGADADADTQRARSFVSLVRVGESFELRGRLDAVWGTIVDNALHRLQLHLDAEQCPPGSRPGHRRAAALVRMAERALAAPKATAPRPLVTIIAGLDDVAGHLCETEEGTPLTRSQFHEVLTRADVESIVFDAQRRHVRISTKERFYTGALRRVIEARDRRCQHDADDCDVPASRAQVDHKIPRHHGGETTEDNGRILCGPHNRARTTRPPPSDEAPC